MKPINFISSLSIKKQKHIRRWLYISTLLFACIGIAIGIIQAVQLYHWILSKNEHQQLIQSINKLEAQLSPTLLNASHKSALVAQVAQGITPLPMIKEIVHTLNELDKQGIGSANSCTIEKSVITLEVVCPTLTDFQAYMSRLHELPDMTTISCLSLHSLEQGSGVHASLLVTMNR